MIEIEFRAWDGRSFYMPIYCYGEWYRDGRSLEDGNPTNDIVEQFTGLRDKNGVKIFENDLLLVKVELAEKYISEGIFSCQINRMGAPEFNFKCLHWEDGAKNQIPVNTTLCEKYGTLDCDYRGEKYDRIAIPEQWGTNHFHGTKWKQSEYTADIEVIGNVHQHPHLLEQKK